MRELEQRAIMGYEEDVEKKITPGEDRKDKVFKTRNWVIGQMRTSENRLDCNWKKAEHVAQAFKTDDKRIWRLKSTCWQCLCSMSWKEAKK